MQCMLLGVKLNLIVHTAKKSKQTSLLTLPMQINSDTTPTFRFHPIRFLDLGCWYLKTNSAAPDQLVTSEAN